MNDLVKFAWLLVVALPTPGLAQKHEHREHEAHVHGSATLAIAFEQLTGQIEFKAAAAGVLGFEHAAKSDSEKTALQKVTQSFEKNISQMIHFEDSLGCQLTHKKIGLGQENTSASKSPHSEHSDFVATYRIKCVGSPLGTPVKFDFTQFKDLHDIDVTFLIGDLQKTLEIKSKPLVLQLKK